MADGNHNNISELKKLDVFEFYSRLEIWEEDLEAKIERLTNKK